MDITGRRAGLEWGRAEMEGEGRRKGGGDFIVTSWKGVVMICVVGSHAWIFVFQVTELIRCFLYLTQRFSTCLWLA